LKESREEYHLQRKLFSVFLVYRKLPLSQQLFSCAAHPTDIVKHEEMEKITRIKSCHTTDIHQKLRTCTFFQFLFSFRRSKSQSMKHKPHSSNKAPSETESEVFCLEKKKGFVKFTTLTQ
jgi:hypothetical protein